jgi:hypothetical protein
VGPLSRDKYPPSDNKLWVRMSVRHQRGGWEVRWRDVSGRQRARRFPSEDAARAFDEASPRSPPPPAVLTPPSTATAAASIPTRPETASDGGSCTAGAMAHRPPNAGSPANDARRRLIEQVERGEALSRE